MFRRDDARRDASDTYGACNVLTRRRPRTFQSVVVVVRVLLLHVSVSNAHRRKKEKKTTKEIIEITIVVVVVSSSSSSKLESSRRGASRGIIYSFKNLLLQVFLGEEDVMTHEITMRREKNNAQNKNKNENENVPSRVSPVQTTRF